jgi:hypothetical protein
LFFLSLGIEAVAQPGNSLKPYLSCKFDDGLKIVETSRHRQWNSPDKFRSIKINGVEDRVSVIDGYRIMLAYPDTYFFANVKAEQSDPQSYAKDKEKLIREMQWLTSTSKEMETAEPVKITSHGFEGYALNRKTILGNTLGMYVLFSDVNQQVLTIYFLNQPAEKRKFQTIEEYRALRDRFLDKYTACIQGNSSRL